MEPDTAVTVMAVACALAGALAAKQPRAERVHVLPANSLRKGHALYDDAMQHFDRVLAFVGDQTAAMPGKVVAVGRDGGLVTIKLDVPMTNFNRSSETVPADSERLICCNTSTWLLRVKRGGIVVMSTRPVMTSVSVRAA